ncbi:secreted protein containing Laminin G, subdomain 2 [Candidatus Magnetomorum sp. HK-1]|nr:secreted protein containing Laminin G, subdomain 2 [Candidatus Magnetomorum sp. HK-1]
MKATKKIFLMIMSIVLIPFLAQADFPVSYQGKLSNTDGVPISDTVSNTISLYTLIEGGEAVWSESHDNVKVENGILNVILGISTDQSQSLFDTLSMHDTLYYSVSINHSEIKPRSRITGVMFAIRAKIADTVKDLAITSDKIKPDAVTSDKIAPNAVTELKIEDGAVSSEKIQDDAISSQKIQDGAVTVQKISDADGNLSLNNELKVNKGISIKELPPNYSPPAEQGYGKIYAKKGNSSLRQDIIFNWRLDERTGDHIDDAIGFCDATAYSNLTVVPGKLGMAKVFDGQTNYIQENNNTDLDFGTDNFSVSFWMKAERPSGWSAIMSKANDWIESKDVCGWLFGNRDSGSDTLEFRINSCGQDKEHRITHAENVFNNEWHHIVGIRDGETIKLFVDGVLKDTAYNVSQSVHVDEPFLIGSVINKYFYSGVIDEVVMWKKPLTVDEVSDLFNQGNGAAIPDELASLYYKRSDGSEVSLIEDKNNIFYPHHGNIGIGIDKANYNIMNIAGSVSINPLGQLFDYEHHSIGGISILHGGSNFPQRALQIRPVQANQHSYILQGAKTGEDQEEGNLWWTYGINKNNSFRINPGGDTIEGESFVINSNGKIGIGTIANSNILHIGGSVSINPLKKDEHHSIGGMSIIHGGTDYSQRALQIRPAESSQHSYIIHAAKVPEGSHEGNLWWTYGINKNNSFRINPGHDTIDGNSFVVNSNSYVGIGTSTPISRFQVNGSTYLNGSLFLTDPRSTLGSSSKIILGYGTADGKIHSIYLNNYWTEFRSHPNQGWKFIVNDSINDTTIMKIEGGTGNVEIKGCLIANNVSCPSDRRYKKNITPITKSLPKLLSMQGLNYNWRSEEFQDKNFTDQKQAGFIAQDLEKVIPEAVSTNKEGFKSIDYNKITPHIVESIKELSNIVQALTKENKALNQKVELLEKMIKN